LDGRFEQTPRTSWCPSLEDEASGIRRQRTIRRARTFPEYPFGRTKLSSANEVYGLVRQCLRDFGCDEEYFGTSRWNPLGTWIQKGQRVVVLPNFVVHRRPGTSLERFSAKCTHSSVLRAVMDYAMIATGDPALVSFGNAPLQGCDHERVRR
jgi:hypothetical protein